jgi:hypothetical protein
VERDIGAGSNSTTTSRHTAYLPIGVQACGVDVGHLLYELCTKLGYCLPPDDQARIMASPPPDIDSFTDEVFRVEGLDPAVDKRERRKVRDLVSRHFAYDD